MMTKTRLETRGSGRHSYVVNVLNKNYANTWTWLLDHCNALASSWIKWFKVFNIYWISNFHLLTKMKPSAIKARVQCLKNSRVVIWNWSGQTLARRFKLWLWKCQYFSLFAIVSFCKSPFQNKCWKKKKRSGWPLGLTPPSPPPKRSGKCENFSTSCHIWGYFVVL